MRYGEGSRKKNKEGMEAQIRKGLMRRYAVMQQSCCNGIGKCDSMKVG
jgi:hypothetical protein